MKDDHLLQDVTGRAATIVDLMSSSRKMKPFGLFVMLQIFSEAKYQGASFNKLVVFDEAHKYIENAHLY